MLLKTESELIEIYSNQKGNFYQCDRRHCFQISFAGNEITLKVKDFLKFKKQVDGIDLDSLILEMPVTDLEILPVHGTDRFLILTVCELVSLKELLAGAKAMLELHRILQHNGCRIG